MNQLYSLALLAHGNNCKCLKGIVARNATSETTKLCGALSCIKKLASPDLTLNANLQLPGKMVLDNNCHCVEHKAHPGTPERGTGGSRRLSCLSVGGAVEAQVPF